MRGVRAADWKMADLGPGVPRAADEAPGRRV